MSRRIVAITIAIVLATLGTVGGLVLVLSAESRAQDGISNPVTVAVAAERIPAGTTGEKIRKDELIRLVRMPKDSVPEDAVGDISTELDSLVVTSNIAEGQILMRANFGSRRSMTSGLSLPEGMMAITVQTGAPEQVAGYVQAGSQVTIFVTYPVVQPDGDRTGIERTRVLLPKVQVLSVGSYQQNRSGASAGERSASLLLTVAVSPGDAEKLISALNHGTLYLGLLSDSVQVDAGPGVDNTDRGTGTPLFP